MSEFLNYEGLSRYDGKLKGYLTRKGIVANVQTNTTASRAYDVGEVFIYNDNLYEVTVAIASGGTITPGTNCSVVTIADELDSIKDSITSIDEFLSLPKSLGSSADLNTLYGADKTGFYYVGANVQNSPFSYAGLINISTNSGATFQFLWSYYDAICYRKRIGDPLKWGDWTYVPQDPYPAINGTYNEYVNTSADNLFSAYISNNIALVTGYFKLQTAITGSNPNVQIGSINLNRTIIGTFFTSSCGNNGNGTRIKLTNSGGLYIERATEAGEYFSFTIPVTLRRRAI